VSPSVRPSVATLEEPIMSDLPATSTAQPNRSS
jgi:hypothetical protein